MATGHFDHSEGNGIAGGGEVLIIMNAVAVAVEVVVNPRQLVATGDEQLALIVTRCCNQRITPVPIPLNNPRTSRFIHFRILSITHIFLDDDKSISYTTS